MNYATICIFLNQLKHPFPNLIIASNLIQPKLPVAISYINDSGGLKTKIKPKQNKKQKKTLQVHVIKCIDRKTEIRHVQTESV